MSFTAYKQFWRCTEPVELNEDSEHPVYRQLADEIERRIEAGDFPKFPKMPSKSDLVREYGVSSTTVDKAMKWLREHDKVHGVRGKGVFAGPEIEQP